MTRTVSTFSIRSCAISSANLRSRMNNAEELSKARKSYDRLLEQARLLRSELARIEQEREEAAGRAGEDDESFPRLFKRRTGPVRRGRSRSRRPSAQGRIHREQISKNSRR